MNENFQLLFKNIINKEKFSQNITFLVKDTLISNQNIFTSYYNKEDSDILGEYKKKWLEFLDQQYFYMIQNYYSLSSETKDETIYFYDNQTFLNFILKIKSPLIDGIKNQTGNLIGEKNLNNEMFSLKNLKNYCFYGDMEEKEKIIENMLERKVLVFLFV